MSKSNTTVVPKKSFLGLKKISATVKAEDVTISMIPMNSSGDIYHVLAYLILAKAGNYDIPRVLLTWDCAEVQLQVKRSHHLLNTLGFSQYVTAQPLNRSTGAFYERARQKDLRGYFEEQAKKIRRPQIYVDQMACTTIISTLLYKEDNSDVVRHHLSMNPHKFYPKKIEKTVNTYVKQEVKKITTYQQAEKHPLIFMHMRYSSKANKEKNIPADFILKLSQYLGDQGYCLWYVLADSRQKGKAHFDKAHESAPFSPPYVTANIEGETYEYGKHKHLGLMRACYGLDNVAGVIGNTSGTLDICAFMGYRVFNIHQFGNQLQYQDYRIMLQASFMTIADLDQDQMRAQYENLRAADAEDVITATLPNLFDWTFDCDHDADAWLSAAVRAETLSVKIAYYGKESVPSYLEQAKKIGFKKMLRFMVFNNGKQKAIDLEASRDSHRQVMQQLTRS